MAEIRPQHKLIEVLILVNAVFAGTVLALVSLREGKLRRHETRASSVPAKTALTRMRTAISVSCGQISLMAAGPRAWR